MTPSRFGHPGGPPCGREKTMVLRVAVLAVFLTCGFLRPEALAVCMIPLEPTRTGFVANVRVDGRGPFRFLIDTGTTVTVVSPSVGVEPNAAAEAMGTTGLIAVREGIARVFRAGGVEVHSLRVLVADLPRFPSHGRIDGILGMNFMEGESVLLDVRRRCLSVGSGRIEGGTLMEAEEVAGRVAVRADGLRLVLDSAASYPVLMSRRARSLATVTGTFEMTSAAGRARTESGTVGLLRIGDIVLRDLDVALIDGADPREDGLLPLTMFTTVFIAADRRTVTINGRPARESEVISELDDRHARVGRIEPELPDGGHSAELRVQR